MGDTSGVGTAYPSEAPGILVSVHVALFYVFCVRVCPCPFFHLIDVL